MEIFLRSKEYWQIVFVGIPDLAEGTTTDSQKTEVEVLKLKDLKENNYPFPSNCSYNLAKTHQRKFGIR